MACVDTLMSTGIRQCLACVCVCVWVCVSLCVYVCLFVCVYLFISLLISSPSFIWFTVMQAIVPQCHDILKP